MPKAGLDGAPPPPRSSSRITRALYQRIRRSGKAAGRSCVARLAASGGPPQPLVRLIMPPHPGPSNHRVSKPPCTQLFCLSTFAVYDFCLLVTSLRGTIVEHILNLSPVLPFLPSSAVSPPRSVGWGDLPHLLQYGDPGEQSPWDCDPTKSIAHLASPHPTMLRPPPTPPTP